MKNNDKVSEFSQMLKNNDLDSCDTLLEKDLYNEALQCFNESLKNDPDNMYALMGKAYSLNQLKKHEEAIEIMNNCIRKDPTNEISRYIKAEIMKDSGQFEIALKLYELLLKGKPNDEEYLIGKAESLKLLGRGYEAEIMFEQFLNLDDSTISLPIEDSEDEMDCPGCSLLIPVGVDCPLCDYKTPTGLDQILDEIPALISDGNRYYKIDFLQHSIGCYLYLLV